MNEKILKRAFSDSVTIVLLFIVIFLQARNFRFFGGGYAFFYLALFVQFFKIYYKNFRREVNTVSQILLLVALSNYAAGQEAANGISNEVVFINASLTMLIVLLTFKMVIWPLRPFDTKDPRLKIKARSRVFEITAIKPMMLTLFYVGISAAIFLAFKDTHNVIPIMFSPVAMFWLAFALSTGLKGAREIPEDYFLYVVNRKEKLNPIFFRKWFLYSVVA
ncbi:MAG: hypothetical protein M0Z48_11440 [Nitrospiraceae bacterium]|nr:hypothetical protein [Nitrospiraceae bacterium]